MRNQLKFTSIATNTFGRLLTDTEMNSKTTRKKKQIKILSDHESMQYNQCNRIEYENSSIYGNKYLRRRFKHAAHNIYGYRVVQ